MVGDVLRVATDTKQQRGSPHVQPREPEEVEPGTVGYAAVVDGIAVLVERRGLDPVEVELEPGRPDHGAHVRRFEVEFSNALDRYRLRISGDELRVRDSS